MQNAGLPSRSKQVPHLALKGTWVVRAGGLGLGGMLLIAALAPHVVHKPEQAGGAEGGGC